MDSIAGLLNSVSSIIKSYEKVAAISGENFNVFSILKMDANEVRLHSAFIGELLSPKGSHGQKDIFLKLFLAEIGITDFDTGQASIEIEKYIGLINEERDEGGRIDLMINSLNNRSIIIENKIYASDGYNQLLRYHNYNNNAILYYLTLHGTDPSSESLHTLDSSKVNLISYQTQIINWLGECKKQAAEFPLLRETITQYINLLKRLTNQSINHEMDEDIIEYILKDTNRVDSAIKLIDRGDILKRAIIKKWIDEVSVKLSIPYTHEVSDVHYFSFKKENWDYMITLITPKKSYEYLKIGILNVGDKKNRFNDMKLVEAIKKVLANMLSGKDLSVEWGWIWLTSYPEYSRADWGELVDGSLTEKVSKYLESIIEIVEKVDGFIGK